MKRTKRTKRTILKKSACCAGMCLLFVTLGGCGSSAKFDAMETTSPSIMEEAKDSSADFSYGYYENGMTDEGEYAEEAPVEQEEATGAETGVPDTTRKLIKTVDMNVETRDFEGLIGLLEKKTGELGGYIENSNVYNGSSYRTYKETRYASLVIRIPKNELDGFIEDVKGASNVVNCNQSVQDITLTYVDLESHKKALETEQNRLLELLEMAGTVEDMITVESRLSQVRYELESMTSRLRSYDNQIDYSTVHMEISEVEELTPVKEETSWERMTHGFAGSVKDVGRDIREFFIRLIISVPYIVVWVIILGAGAFLVIALARHSMKKKVKKTPVEKETEE